MTGNVIFDDGSHGILIEETENSAMDGSVEIQMDGGQKILVPQSEIIQQAAGNYFVAALPTTFTDIPLGETIVVPLVAEDITIDKRVIETGKLRLVKSVEEHAQTIDEPLTRTDYEMRRVSINQFVDSVPAVRYEGDIMIIPVMEEVLVVEKRLRLKEEVHVIPQKTEFHEPQTVTLRVETLTEERIGLEDQ